MTRLQTAKRFLHLLALTLLSCGQDGERNVRGSEAGPPTAPAVEAPDYEGLLEKFASELEVIEEQFAEEGERADLILRAAELAVNAGVCLDALGRHDEAIEAFEQGRERFDRLGDGFSARADGIGACEDGLGLACHSAGYFIRAEKHFKEAIDWRTRAGKNLESVSKAHLGNLYVSMARYREAERCLREALATAEDDETKVRRNGYLGKPAP